MEPPLEADTPQYIPPGSLAGQLTGLAAENEALRGRAERAEKQQRSWESYAVIQEHRAQMAETEAAVLRLAIEAFLGEQIHVRPPEGNPYWMWYEPEVEALRQALATTDAGAALLAEIDKLRGTLRSIRRATGPNEMRQLAGEVLGEDEAKGAGE